MPKKPVLVKAPLTDACFAPLPLKAVRPQGKLLKKLKEAAKWAGQLEWKDEQFLGFAALALLTDDTRLTETVKARVEKIITAEPEGGDGGLCAQAALYRGLIAWYAATADKRILIYLLKQVQFLYRRADTLFQDLHQAALTGEFGYTAICLYQWTGKEFLLRFLEKLRALGLDWTGYFHTFPVTRAFLKFIPREELKKGLNSPDEKTRDYYGKQQIMADGTALARGLKTPAILSRFTGSAKEHEAGRLGLEKLTRYHGTALGLFAAEPELSGGNPSGLIDGRVAAEAMFSLEQMLAVKGEGQFYDELEKIALNILPAMESGGRFQPRLSANGPYPKERLNPADALSWAEAWLSGMTGYCSSLFMASKDDGLALMGYVPSLLRWKVGKENISIRVQGNYPFSGEITLDIHVKNAVAFPLHLRIPQWAQDASVRVNTDGAQSAESGSFFILNRTFCDGDKVYVSLPVKPRLTRWQHQSAAVEYGPLLMALPVDGEQPIWQAAILESGELTAELHKEPGDERLSVAAPFKKAPGWAKKGDRPQMPPIAPETEGDKVMLHLTPYAQTEGRMAQFPVIREA